ncbi:hypothetical protein BGZ93_005479 [Podila epicladia]|nr:hypothetical protein BGZ93_005479 [Podila epicladia]
MSQVKTNRISLQAPGTSRTHSSSSLASSTATSRPRRITVNLPKAAVTAAAFVSPMTGESTLTEQLVSQERARYTMLVSKNTTSESLMKMPNVATKPVSTDDEVSSSTAVKLPSGAPVRLSNMKLTVDDTPTTPSLTAFPAGSPYQLQKQMVEHKSLQHVLQ